MFSKKSSIGVFSTIGPPIIIIIFTPVDAVVVAVASMLVVGDDIFAMALVALVALVAFVVRGVVVNMGEGTVDGIALVAVVAVLPVFASD